ncbi:MAG: chemotaxis protein CheC [Candidatus Scalindua sp.]|nr:chemotaxis protein CheC [Candidatus Scalindua sp.]
MITMSSDQLDALKEMIGVGMGKAAGMLNEMLESHIELKVPSLSIIKSKDLNCNSVCAELGGDQLTSVSLGFQGSYKGNSTLVFPEESAVKLVAALTNEEPGSTGLDSVMAGTMSEVGNIVINGVMGSIGNYLKDTVEYSLPNYLEGKLTDLLGVEEFLEETYILLAETTFKVQNLQVEGSIFVVFEYDSFGNILSEINDLY